MKILIATGNQNKLEQFKRIFESLGSDIELVSLKDVEIFDDVEEDQETLLGNAKKKAKFYAEKSGLLSLSDDFGIFVDALDGFPGVNSKRWIKGSDKDRCLALIEKLKNFPKEKWTAKYIGAVALYDPKEKEFWKNVSEAEGVVVDEFRGDQFFGYDSIFESKKFGKTFAELSDEEKMFVGHRSIGMKELVKHLNKQSLF